MNDSVTLKLAKRRMKEFVKSALIGKTDAADRVFIGRSVPTQTEDLPVLLIYSTGENVSRFNEAPKNYQRNMNLLVECIVAGNDDDDLDIKMETLAEKVETILENDETLGGIANKLELSGSDYQSEPDAQSPIGNLALRFNVEFYTDAIREGVCLDTFKGADVDWKIGHHAGPSDNVVDAEDKIDVIT